jgi:hypothetical protein
VCSEARTSRVVLGAEAAAAMRRTALQPLLGALDGMQAGGGRCAILYRY